MDFSEESAFYAKDKYSKYNEFLDSMHIENLPTPLQENSADIIFLMEVIEHLSDDYLSTTLIEVKRLLKPGGALIITTPNDENLQMSNNFCPECGAIYHRWQHVRTLNPNTIREILEEYDFTDIKTYEKTFITIENIFIRILRSIYNFIKTPKYNNLICIANKKTK